MFSVTTDRKLWRAIITQELVTWKKEIKNSCAYSHLHWSLYRISSVLINWSLKHHLTLIHTDNNCKIYDFYPDLHHWMFLKGDISSSLIPLISDFLKLLPNNYLNLWKFSVFQFSAFLIMANLWPFLFQEIL